MSTGKKKKNTWIQCNECGKIFQIPRSVPIEELYTIARCPRCGFMMGLNLGDKKEDIYLYGNPNLDERYF